MRMIVFTEWIGGRAVYEIYWCVCVLLLLMSGEGGGGGGV